MDTKALHTTKKKLAIIFAAIVFFIALLLEMIFFSFKYINISWSERQQFAEITSQIEDQILLNPKFLTLFIREGINFGPPRNTNLKRGNNPGGPERGLRFLNFFLLDKNGNILAQNYNQDIQISLDILNSIGLQELKIIKGVVFKKIDIQSVEENYQELIFFKRLGYTLENYIQDIVFFLLINILFSIFFYFIGLYFVGKNLKPVEQSFSDMNDFIHNANHELKTPISVISSNMQLLKSIKKYEEALVSDSLTEINRMSALLDGLSELSNISDIQEKQTVKISQIIQEIEQELKNDIAGKKLDITINMKNDIQLQANKQYLYIVFSNLLRNAIKYNHQNGHIDIILDKNIFTISNTGETIEKKDMPFIFDRFFKGEKSRNTTGFGIGLSLVKKICDIYGWRISLSSNDRVSFQINFK